MNTSLSVNLNKIALLRNTRDLDLPSVVRAAHTCIDAGAHGITVHPRPDERHGRPGDVIDLAAVTRERGVEFNVEGYPSADFLALVRRVRPDQVTLVPDAPDQRTSDPGWDVVAQRALLGDVVPALAADGMRVSLFMDPDPMAMTGAAALGTHRVELYTEPDARGYAAGRGEEAVAPYVAAAEAARDAGLGVNAGHDLNLHNLGLLRARIPYVAEVSIGHALVADAIDMGLAAAVRAYLDVLNGG